MLRGQTAEFLLRRLIRFLHLPVLHFLMEVSTASLCNLVFQVIVSASLLLMLFVLWQIKKKKKKKASFDIFHVLACTYIHTHTKIHLSIFLTLLLMTAHSSAVHFPRQVLFLIVFNFPSDTLYVCLY